MPSYGVTPNAATVRVGSRTKTKHIMLSPLALPFLPLWLTWQFFAMIVKAISLVTSKEPARKRR